MEYRADQAKVTYCSKARKEKKTYDALEWLANHRPQPRAHSPTRIRSLLEDSTCQLPPFQEEDYSQAPPAHWDG
jgi:hypothetical protein